MGKSYKQCGEHRRNKEYREPPPGEYLAVILADREITGEIRRYRSWQIIHEQPGMRTENTSGNAESRRGDYHTRS